MSKRFRLLYALVIPAMLLTAAAGPAVAKGKGSGGKKPVATVVSFDGTTLTMQSKDGSTLSAPVADDVQIKVEHRGRKGQAKTKKPSNGTLADLVAGAPVLRVKMECDEVVKLRLRAVPAPVAATTEDEGPATESDPADDAGCGDEDSTEEADELESEDEADESDGSEDDSEEDEDSEDAEEEEEDPGLLEDVLDELPL